MKTLNHRELNALFRSSDIMKELVDKATKEEIKDCYIESCLSRFMCRSKEYYTATPHDFNTVVESLKNSLTKG